MKLRRVLPILLCGLYGLLDGQVPVLQDIPGGSVWMGCTPEQSANYICNTFEKPVHRVTVYPFQLGKYEVKQSEWDSMVPERSASDEFCNGPDRPACLVSFYEALTYCNRLSLNQNLRPCYYTDTAFTAIFDTLAGSETMQFSIPVYWDLTAEGYRLPTESEWEYAARAGENSYVFAGSNTADNVAWYSVNSNIPYGCRNVGAKSANAWGMHDMSGNVWEWAWDISDFYPSQPVVNAIGPPGAWQNQRSARGGSYVNFSEDLRVGARGADNPGLREGVTGFRVARGSMAVSCTDTLLVPMHTSSGVNPCAAIRWGASNFAVTGYEISIGTSPGGSELLADHIVPDTFYYPEPSLPVGDTVFIRIIPFTNSLRAEGCGEFWFVTEGNAPQNPLTLLPPEQPLICEYTQDLLLTGDFALVDSVKWSTGEVTSSITVSETGIYTVEVYFEGCKESLSSEILQGIKPVPDQDLTIIFHTLPGQSTGAIDITIKGGVPPYQFTWKSSRPPYTVISHEEDVYSLQAGNYEVYILDKVGCGKNWFYTFTIDSILLGSSDLARESFAFYPIPASDYLNFDAQWAVSDFMIFDATGQRLMAGIAEQNSIPIADLPEGLYFLMFKADSDKWRSQKFIISRSY